MDEHKFCVTAGTDNVAEYAIVIPVKNMTDEYDLVVRTATGEALDVITTSHGEFVVERKDQVGEQSFSITIQHKSNNAVCTGKTVRISIFQTHAPAMIEDIQKRCVPIVLAWNDATKAIADRLWAEYSEACVPIVNRLFLEALSDKTVWPKYCYLLYYLIPHINSDKRHIELAMSMFEKAIEVAGQGNQVIWSNQGLLLEAAPIRKNKFCLHAIKCGIKGDTRIIDTLQSTTPTSQKEDVAETILAEGFVNYKELELFRNFNYRKGAPRLHQMLQSMSADNSQIPGFLNLLADWDYREAAPAAVQILEMTINKNIFNSAIKALKKFEYRKSVPVLKEMLPVSSSEKAATIEELLKYWNQAS